MKLPEPENQNDEIFLAYMKDPGWGITHMPKTYKGPGYSYSVGLYFNFGHPEFVVTGLPAALAQDILNDAGEMVSEGKKFENLEKSDEILEAFSCGFLAVDHRNYARYLGVANWFYAALKEPFPCLQILWPDKKGILPTEKGADPKLLKVQPLLSTCFVTPRE